MTDKVIKCKYCNQLEYWGEFRWLSGKIREVVQGVEE
jgi:hypothetical protein